MRRMVILLLAVALPFLPTGPAAAQGTLRIGMTASDIPYTGGQTDNGFEGFRFVGYQIYESLIAWDLTRGDRLAPLVPGLAESWDVRKDAPTKWVFKLRKGVTFHDGSPFNARRGGLLVRVDQEEGCAALRHLRVRAGQLPARLDHRDHARSTTTPWSSRRTSPPASCPTSSATCSSCRRPSGRRSRTGASSPSSRPAPGPSRSPRSCRASGSSCEANKTVLGRQAPAQDRQARAPAHAGADHAAGRAAQRPGRLDRGAAARRDSAAQGRRLYRSPSTAIPTTGRTPSRLDKEPWNNKLVRKAANYAIDRVGICKNLLNDTCIPGHRRRVQGPSVVRQAQGDLRLQPGQGQGAAASQAGFDGGQASGEGGAPHLDLRLRPDAAAGHERAHPEESQGRGHRRATSSRWSGTPCSRAGGPASRRRTTRASTPGTSRGTSSSRGAASAGSSTARRWCPSPSTPCPTSIQRRTSSSTRRSGPSTPPSRTRSSRRLHEIVVDDAPWIFVVHDQNPRALSPKVKGFVQPQSWFVDLTAVTVR